MTDEELTRGALAHKLQQIETCTDPDIRKKLEEEAQRYYSILRHNKFPFEMGDVSHCNNCKYRNGDRCYLDPFKEYECKRRWYTQ